MMQQLFRRFEFEVMDPGNPWVCRSWNAVEQRDFWLKAHPRNSPSVT
jgi:hypothetical protein